MVSPPSPIGAALYRWRSAPEPTGGDPRSVRRLPGPFPVVVVPVRTSHRVSGSTCDGYSSRSQPVLRDVGAEYGRGSADASSPPASARRRLEAVAAQNGERRIARETGLGPGPLAQAELAAPLRGHDPRVPARRAQAGARIEVTGRRHRLLARPWGALAERVGFEPTKSFD